MPQTTKDAVEEFAYNSENERYNNAYHKWRSRTDAPFIYRYRKKANEVTYTEGNAVEPLNATVAERKALLHTAELIGTALLICLFCDIALRPVTVWLLGRLGFNIRVDFLSLTTHGSQWLTAAVRALSEVLKYAVPTAVMVKLFRLPRQVCCPAMPGGVPEQSAAVGIALTAAAFYTLTDFRDGVEMAQRIFEYKDSAAVFIYALFDVFIVSLLAELLLRGTILQVLRQFGDPFAVVTTAAIGFMLPNTLSARVGEFVIGLGAGYLFLRGGSFFKCAMLRGIFVMLTYARLVLIYGSRTLPLWSFVILMFSTGALSLAFFVIRRHGKIKLENRRSSMTFSRKFSAMFETVSTFPWVALSALLAVVQLFS